MRSEFLSHFDENFLLGPFGTNQILFMAEFQTLVDLIPGEEGLSIEQVEKGISLYYDEVNDVFTDNDGLPISRDNYIAIMSLSKKYALDYHKKVRFGHHMLVPWDAIFFLAISESMFSFLGKLLLPISCIFMIFTVLFKTYKNNILDTSGSLLTWLLINNFSLDITKKICDNIVLHNFPEGWRKYFRVYFGENHPNTILAEEYYK